MSAAWARPGTQCVCVKKGAWVKINNPTLPLGVYAPKFGEICTIKAVEKRLVDGITVLTLVGFPGRYLISRFRPLVTRTEQQDVQMFLSLLETAGEDA